LFNNFFFTTTLVVDFVVYSDCKARGWIYLDKYICSSTFFIRWLTFTWNYNFVEFAEYYL